MENGVYDLIFSIGVSREDGQLTIDGDLVRARTPGFELHGNFTNHGGILSARVTVGNRPASPFETPSQHSFTVVPHGVCDARGLSLIGSGPLGAIIELNANAVGDRDGAGPMRPRIA